MGRFVGSGVPNHDPRRLETVLNAKYRLIGVDVQALDAQVKEKADAHAARQAEDSARACLSHGFTSTLGAAAAAAAAARAAWDKEVSAFRAEAQPKATRREWDLSRPDALQIDTPARIGDDDPRCGPASMQRFYGEDLLAADRADAQMQQARAWWDRQAAERAAERAAAAAAAAAQADLAAQQDAAQRDLAATEAVRRDHFKGMSAAQRAAVREGQLVQVEGAREDGAMAEAAEARAAAAGRDVGAALARQALNAELARRQQAAATAEALRRQMEEKRVRDAALREVYANRVAPSYFEQFGTSHR
ncbi:hypothetical protein MNEG_6478 [Monoraphidium neglectum]|uniref:RIB43A-like with coiled-coils protein 2 n=1 Tax=Monoraphidium neglectum TaxID=145388 RepID=A0A0D2L2J3_9CHLO|nr:hypothetical protein MNEG_6478 [Monoraphidium neglectum]KIZ01484.1 hypothetical protein MNEG_6478 [Monoraphidium neglectum]|eukprot:XP_013900503.1 hypothetical protein MNEG_6478 [Monoraphidium neglectum]